MANDQSHLVTEEAQSLLSDLVNRSGALTAILLSKEGVCIADAGETSYFDTKVISALVAVMFSATRELARAVGETNFYLLLQQGETRHIHISTINPNKLMVVVFEDYQRLGLVRQEARNAGARIGQALSSIHENGLPSDSEQYIFKEYALNLIDRVFKAG